LTTVWFSFKFTASYNLSRLETILHWSALKTDAGHGVLPVKTIGRTNRHFMDSPSITWVIDYHNTKDVKM
jgi:hypothetical protein